MSETLEQSSTNGVVSTNVPEVKKKRNRWGSSAEDSSSLNSAPSAQDNVSKDVVQQNGNSDDTESKNFSLSGVDVMASIQAAKEAAAAAAAASKVDVAAETTKKRSRFSANPEATTSAAPSLGGAVATVPAVTPYSTASLSTALVIPGAPLPILTGGQMIQQALTPEVIQQSLVMKMQLQGVTDRLVTVAADAARIELDPDRSPSPPPKYDAMGKRTNTREIRMREKLMAERTKLITDLVKLNPTYIPPPDFVRQKPVKRIFLPAQGLNPMHNYIGLVIGPRGNTQKELEQKSGCKISIRGKGSVKEGSQGRANKQVVDEEYDLHVHITGETDEQVAYAVRLVQEILSPREEDLNAHKQKQLRELALINGTLKEDEYCPICGEKGHRHFECPHKAKSFKAAQVKCSICGDLSHPTRDCPLKQTQKGEVFIDNEYDSFMAELGGNPSGGGNGGDSTGASGGDAVNPYSSYKEPTPSAPQIISVPTLMTGLTKPVSIVDGTSGAGSSASASSSSSSGYVPPAGVTVLPTINMMDMLNASAQQQQAAAMNPYAGYPGYAPAAAAGDPYAAYAAYGGGYAAGGYPAAAAPTPPPQGGVPGAAIDPATDPAAYLQYMQQYQLQQQQYQQQYAQYAAAYGQHQPQQPQQQQPGMPPQYPYGYQ